MQVATLFRESTNLLDAEMEDGAHIKMGNFHDASNMKPESTRDDGYETAGGGDNDASKHHLQQHNLIHNHPIPHLSHRMALMPSNSNHIKEEAMMKYEMPDDPYSFVDDDHVISPQCTPTSQQVPKRRGRKKKLKLIDHQLHESQVYQGLMSCLPNHIKGRGSGKGAKERKKHDRFNGMPEEEVSKRTLPDHLTQNLDIVIIGINPGLFAAYKGHHYAGPGNHFWKCLFLSGLTPEPMTADDDYKLLKVGIGFTNMVERPTKGSADLTRKEIKEGSQRLLEKLRKFKPKIAVFNGKLIFEVFSGKKDFSFGRQPERVDGTDTYMWVMPSSSARCAQLPRAADKVPFYAALKKFRDYLNGLVTEIDEKELVFSYSNMKSLFESDEKKEVDDGLCSFEIESSGASILENEASKEDEVSQPKKKRGRPKKIKVEGEMKALDKLASPTLKEKNEDDKSELPKKKRGRPKKVKGEPHPVLPSPSDASNSHSHCFSPPIHSPSMQHFPIYPHTLYNQSSRSPISSSYHPSPLRSHGYNQSPQPPSFTHSDLSSEISAAISSEHNPESPTMGPPDFEPPATLSDEINCKSNEEKDKEYQFSPPQSKKTYQNFDDFSTDSDSAARLPHKHMSQDLTSKSLSGLESLVDQIPNIADGEPPHAVGVESEPLGSQYSDDSAYMSDYGRSHYSPQYSTPTSNSFLQHHSNFSVTSLANSSVSDNSFSVGSLAGNYQQPAYPSLMAPPVSSVIEVNPPLFNGPLERSCHVEPNFNFSNNAAIPYPYSQYPTYPNSGSGFYPTSHNIHMPSPNYPYPSPYSSASYPQPSYLPNHMFDRYKSDRMEFSGF